MIDDVIVVGGGPAGASCALWAHRLGLGTLLLEAGPALGGLQRRSPYINHWVPGLPDLSGQEIAARLQAQLEAAGVRFRLNHRAASIRRVARGLWEVSNGMGVHTARHVVIATGSRPRRGGFAESDRVGIGPGMSMERLEVSGRRVAILGGGDNAFDQAFSMLTRGAASVDIHCRQVPRAQPLLQRRIPADRVHVGPFQADPQRLTVDGRPYDLIGVQYGFDACIPGGLVLPLHDGAVDVDRRGAVRGHPGLFAAGEVTNYWHPCVATACAHGVQVAKSIQAGLHAGGDGRALGNGLPSLLGAAA